VRELRNAIERISIFAVSAKITPAILHETTMGATSSTSADTRSILLKLLQSHRADTNLLDCMERDLIDLALQESQGNAAEAARILGVHRNALLRRIEKYDLR
jgi:two-component system NtrC family response regulator